MTSHFQKADRDFPAPRFATHRCRWLSPLFSNATVDHRSSAEPKTSTTTPAATQKRSKPHGDHHLLFVDLADSAGRR